MDNNQSTKGEIMGRVLENGDPVEVEENPRNTFIDLLQTNGMEKIRSMISQFGYLPFLEMVKATCRQNALNENKGPKADCWLTRQELIRIAIDHDSEK